jgi:hypothetical protein
MRERDEARERAKRETGDRCHRHYFIDSRKSVLNV